MFAVFMGRTLAGKLNCLGCHLALGQPAALCYLFYNVAVAVTCLESPGGGATGRLVAMGVLPGATILLVQRSPAFVMRLGHTELAVDAELAARIRVRCDRR